ncbi:MAG: C4-type zinc ribbon domain-containing protein [Planctomycetota bacterium]
MESIDHIKKVQSISGKISLLQSEVEKKMERIRASEQTLENLQTESEPCQQRITQGRVLSNKFEIDVGELTAKIDKSSDQLDKATSANEFNSLKVQLARLEEEKSSTEENLLLIMEKIEEIEKQVADINERSSHAKQQLDEIRSVVGKEIEEYQLEIQSMEQPLQQAREVTDPELLEIFDRLYSGIGATVVVAIEGNTCGGCHMNLSAQMVEMANKGTAVVCCPICSRILS